MRRLLFIAILSISLLQGCGSPEQEPPSSTASTQMQAQQLQMKVEPGVVLLPRSKAVIPSHIGLTGIEAPVVPLHLTGDALVPPSDPHVLGWWGKKAGAFRGVTLLVGHTVHTGGGTLDNLEDVAVGTDVDVSGMHYTVTSNRIISKPALAKRAAQLFSQTGPPRLVVVTCEGYNWTTHVYSSNVVMVAMPSS